MSRAVRVGLLAGAMLALAGNAMAKTYVASTYLNPTQPLAQGGYVLFPEAVKKATNGEITFQVHLSASLLPFRAHLRGIGDGVAHVGQIAGTYTPSEIPLQQVLADLAFANPDPYVIAFASTEINMTHPQLLAEWSKNNVVFGGGYATTAYMLICRAEVKSMADLKGKKVRTPGSAWDRMLKYVGAVPINVPSSEMYTGLDSGNLDCAANGADTLKTFSLWEVAKSINTVKLGLYFSGWLWGYNKDFWKEIRPEHRRVLFNEMARHIVKTQVLYQEAELEALRDGPQRGVKVNQPAPDLQAAIDKFAREDLDSVEKISRETYKVQDPRPLIDAFNGQVAKWTKLLDGIPRTDEARLTALLRAEVYDKLDAATYGLK